MTDIHLKVLLFAIHLCQSSFLTRLDLDLQPTKHKSILPPNGQSYYYTITINIIITSTLLLLLLLLLLQLL